VICGTSKYICLLPAIYSISMKFSPLLTFVVLACTTVAAPLEKRFGKFSELTLFILTQLPTKSRIAWRRPSDADTDIDLIKRFAISGREFNSLNIHPKSN
jgi:hypothetical protein